MLLVLLSILLALPIAWYLVQIWMQDFEYRVVITGTPFIIAGMTVVNIALLAISNQAMRAALRSPIRAIQNE